MIRPMKNMTSRFCLLALGFLVISGLSACAPILAVPPASSFDAPLNVENDDALLIRAGDKLKVTVYGDDVMTGEYSVNSKGFVSLPLIGQTQAAGLSQPEIQDSIIATLKKKKFMNNASVTVDVTTPRPFYVLGEVKNAGTYPYESGMTAIQSVASAGGYSPRAAHNCILIDRKQGDKMIRLNAKENTPILPGDSIIVRERIF